MKVFGRTIIIGIFFVLFFLFSFDQAFAQYYGESGYYGEGGYYSEGSYNGDPSQNGYSELPSPTPTPSPTPIPPTPIPSVGICGNVFMDNNGSGTLGSPPDVSMAGQTVSNITNGTSAVTDGNGNYCLPRMPAGTYTINYPTPGGLIPTTPSSVTQAFVVDTAVYFGVATPPPPPDANGSVGYQDGVVNATCSTSGWALDKSSLNTSIAVHAYRDGPAGVGTFIGSYPTTARRDDVNGAFGAPPDSNHGFNIAFDTGTGLYTDTAHSIYLYAIDSDGGTNPLLENSPMSLTCSLPKIGICGNVFTDMNRNAASTGNAPDGPDYGYSLSNQYITLSNGESRYTDGNGNYCFGPLNQGTYTVTYSGPPAGYGAATPTSYTQNFTADTPIYFGVLLPPTPIISPDPPTSSCVGTTPTVSFSWSAPGATWFEVYQHYNGSTSLIQASSATSVSYAYSAGNGAAGIYYEVRSFYGQGSPQFTSATTTQPVTLLGCLTITGNVYTDTDHDGVLDAGEPLYNGASVRLNGANIQSSPATYYPLRSGTYSLAITVPSGYKITDANGSYSISLGSTNETRNFLIAPIYTVSGAVFIDTDRDGVKDSGESNYTPPMNIRLVGIGTQDTSGGAYSFSNLYSGDYLIHIATAIPSGYIITPTTSSSYNFNLSSNTVINFALVPVYTIPAPSQAGATGTVYVDQNRNGSYASGDTLYNGAQLTLSGSYTYPPTTFTSQTTNTTSGGLYSFPNPTTSYLFEGDYTITLTNPNPARYQMPAAAPGFHLPPSGSGPSFGIIPRYQISGVVFDDVSKDGVKNGAESNMTDGAEYNIQIRGPVDLDLTTTGGAYTTGTTLYEGEYTVTYVSDIPAGYRMTNPENTIIDPSFTVTVGRNCTVNSVEGASCLSAGLQFSASDVQNLNFGMTNCMPWFQLIGSNGRIDGSFFNDGTTQNGFSDPIPDSAIAECGGTNASTIGPDSTTPGIIFSDGTPDFGQGQASTPQNWQVDSSYAPATINTSYGYMMATIRQSGIEPIDLPAACTQAGGCSITNLESGIYHADSEVTLTTSAVSGNKQIVIMVNGDLHIIGAILVPAGNSLTVSTAGDIDVEASVGNTLGDITSTTAQVEGFYSTDGSFIIRGNNTSCAADATPDRRFNIAGSVVVNAANTGGSLQNQRDLGIDNRSCPAFSMIGRPDFLLNAPEFIKRKADVWREVAP